MTVLLDILLFLHMIGWAIVLGAALVGLKGGTLYSGTFHAALTALVTGVLMALIASLWASTYREQSGSYPEWVAVKLVLGLVITGLVWFARARPNRVGRFLVGTVAVLTVVNVGVATIWH